ncbi:cAMP phosphodiesterase [Heterostelium album PN500]|uniref:Phosphodiesterase n=1 Tax=Heterostelium pallidum (strain ATCC 26659 / Pp 5 / PN500) TaxID=670386 RepID=D3B3H3_HETP5|nr:cAMP phosphodiesterase [Heterostelium album PN500]EFA83871.1 cAMP phosphodiesterase [Heterostelium album PN500]|eukprot:XP_020435988.1 cAMP phosphodiesterase [Heterostelium album PN500]
MKDDSTAETNSGGSSRSHLTGASDQKNSGDCMVDDCVVIDDLRDKQCQCHLGKLGDNQKSQQQPNGRAHSVPSLPLNYPDSSDPQQHQQASPKSPSSSSSSTTTKSSISNSISNSNSNSDSNNKNLNNNNNNNNNNNGNNNGNNNSKDNGNGLVISDQLPAEYSPSKVHILVVDDDIVQRSLLNNMLKKFNFNVTLVTNGEEAWDTLLNGKVMYDLVLTDVMMPMVTGFDLLQRINEHIEIKHIPVILMSGTAVDYKYANDTIKIGGQDFLTKPIAKELLKKKIDTVLTSIWQKKKEAEYKSFLARERENRSILAKQMEAKEHEIEELTRKISEMASISREAMESPLVSVTRTIEELMQQTNWTDHENDIKYKLTMILKELGSSNIYRPSFEKLIKNESVDPVTKSFLVTEFSSVTGARRNSIPTFPQTVSSKDTKEGIKGWNFDVFRYSEDDLMPMLVDMFENFQLLETFKIPIEKLQRFIMAVHSLYRKSNRYHNFLHAFDVTQTCYTFLTTFKAAQYLTHLDILSLLIAAMCHDLNHPGFNNTFQVNAQTDLTLQYNDNSVLENHHATLTFKILKNSDCNILEGLNEDQYKELRRSVIQLILATDMAFHFELDGRSEEEVEKDKTPTSSDKASPNSPTDSPSQSVNSSSSSVKQLPKIDEEN